MLTRVDWALQGLTHTKDIKGINSEFTGRQNVFFNGLDGLPLVCPYSLEQVLDEEFYGEDL